MIAALALLLADPTAEAVPDWRGVATLADRVRLRAWRSTWRDAIAGVRGGDDRAAIGRDAALFDPDDALDRPLPPAGDYRCRMTKIAGDRVMTDGWTPCRIGDGAAPTLERTNGGQRFVGWLFTDDTHRGVFLGSLAYADERRPTGYGRDDGRDMAGLVTRIEAKRWRIALPAPHFESKLDLLELETAP